MNPKSPVSPPAPAPIRVGMISLGCAKNLVDAEVMLGTLIKDGVEITNDAESADVLVVNTCSFIDSAQEESVDTILESSALREHVNPGQALVVSGCLPQRFKDELPKLLPEVDVIMGIDQVANVTDLIKQAVAHRRAKRAALPERRPPTRRGQKVKATLAKLDQQKGSHTHDDEQTLRGTDQFGQTRQVIAAPPSALRTARTSLSEETSMRANLRPPTSARAVIVVRVVSSRGKRSIVTSRE